MSTGFGRFCRECKVGLSAHYYISPETTNRHQRNSAELSRGDMNKLNSFSENPEKYATRSSRARGKVEYLESIKHKLSGLQMAQFIEARKKYNAALVAKPEPVVTNAINYEPILKEAFNNHKSVKIRYKGSWRTIDPYSLNATYLVAYCHLARDIRTFRLDRIQEAELSDSFSFNNSFQETAKSRLVEAPTYRGYRPRRY